jgi:hypothetical protein
MDALANQITEDFGERCPDYAPGCICCELWKDYDRLTAAGPLSEEEADMAMHWLDRYSAGIDEYAQFDRVRPEAFDEAE